jgi:hypothetical protein
MSVASPRLEFTPFEGPSWAPMCVERQPNRIAGRPRQL